jgi:hypothetical protein
MKSVVAQIERSHVHPLSFLLAFRNRVFRGACKLLAAFLVRKEAGRLDRQVAGALIASLLGYLPFIPIEENRNEIFTSCAFVRGAPCDYLFACHAYGGARQRR